MSTFGVQIAALRCTDPLRWFRKTMLVAVGGSHAIIAFLWHGLDGQPHREEIALFGISPSAPAITPRMLSPDPSVPSFTASDAEAYVTAHPRFQSSIQPVARSVEFLTTREIEARSRITPGGEPDRLICVVMETGFFNVSGPGFGALTDRLRYYFDARTGDYLATTVLSYPQSLSR